jgi:hypothetical protein
VQRMSLGLSVELAMSVETLIRDAWCKATLTEAVAMWHRQRAAPENEHIELAQLAVDCAWYMFHRRGHRIVGDVEACAKRYAELAYDRFQDECRAVIMEPEPVEELIA